ncbi:MAG: beta-ketoacyl-ACP synthase II, partial [Opitutaceae bacterium]|nr:beta-ketoacyl-ACP synthase II [Verrucomicrobiales bacterium]
MSRRVVITGIGLLCSVGSDTDECWQALQNGRSGVGTIAQFDPTAFSCRIAGEVKNFDPGKWIEKKEQKKVGKFIQFAIASADMAMAASGLKIDDQTAERVGVYIGSGIGGFEVIEREHKNLLEKGPGRISPFFIPATIVNLASGQVSIRTGAKGPNSAVATACTTGAHAIGDSFKIIQRDDADAMICGGTEAAITPMGVGGFAAMRALSTRNDEPSRASRPWDRDRDGFVVGEGAGILILEELEFAKRRGAPILAEIIGYGMSADAFHITSPSEDGEGAYRVMRNALRDAKLEPSQISYINAHGTSTPLGDKLETVAIKRAFGDHARKVMVSSTKSMTGHLLGGAGGLEAGITVLAIRDSIAPPTINYDTPDPEC